MLAHRLPARHWNIFFATRESARARVMSIDSANTSTRIAVTLGWMCHDAEEQSREGLVNDVEGRERQQPRFHEGGEVFELPMTVKMAFIGRLVRHTDREKSNNAATRSSEECSASERTPRLPVLRTRNVLREQHHAEPTLKSAARRFSRLSSIWCIVIGPPRLPQIQVFPPTHERHSPDACGNEPRGIRFQGMAPSLAFSGDKKQSR